MRKINIIFFILCFCFSAKAQHWDSLGRGTGQEIRVMYADTVNDYLYIGGSFLFAGGNPAHGIVKWDGTTWATFNNTDLGAICTSIIRYNGSIYASGQFYNTTPYSYVVKWNGTGWDSLGSASNGGVGNLVVYNNELYALGTFTNFKGITTANDILIWDGSVWSTLDDTLFDGAISAMAFYNGELYFGGSFTGSDGYAVNILRWNGTHWNSVGGGMHGGMDDVGNLLVYNNELYVSGTFTKADGNTGNYIQKWNGTTWSEVGGGVMGAGGGNGQIEKLLIFHNKLYAFGDFVTAGGIRAEYIASWDGTNWCGFGSTFDNILNVAAVYKDSLYIAGGFHTIDGDSINRIAKWIGGNYVDTCGRIATGIAEEVNNEDVSIYPNPFTSATTITFNEEQKNTTIKITDVLGKEVKTINFTGKQYILEKGEIKAGVYFVQITNENNTINKKVIIQ